jgi:hypothetical protein
VPCQGAQGVAPAAADQTLGMAMMSAVVSSVGLLVNGAGAVSAARIGDGTYNVVFARDVTGCAYVAMAGNINSTGGTTSVYAQGFYLADPKGIRILMKDPLTGNHNDGAFHLMVFCHQ